MIRVLAAAVAVLTVFSARAQTAEPLTRHAVYGEAFGNALLYSVNYERRLNDRVIGRIGLSVAPFEDDEGGETETVVLVPLMVSSISHPRSNHHFEAGIGLLIAGGERVELADFGDDDESFSTAVGTATIGYRYQRPGGGFVFRAGLTPLFDFETLLPWLGVSFGRSF